MSNNEETLWKKPGFWIAVVATVTIAIIICGLWLPTSIEL